MFTVVTFGRPNILEERISTQPTILAMEIPLRQHNIFESKTNAKIPYQTILENNENANYIWSSNTYRFAIWGHQINKLF